MLMNMAMLCLEGHWLPRAGGLLDQDAWFVEVLQTVSAAKLERKNQEMARAQRQAPKARGR